MVNKNTYYVYDGSFNSVKVIHYSWPAMDYSGQDSSVVVFCLFFCFYNFLTHFRVRLSKCRGRTAKSTMNSKLVVKHREMTEDEIYAQVNG